MKRKSVIPLAAIATLMAVENSQAQVSFTGSYSQNFDSLANTGTTATWANNSTIAGWYLFGYAGTTVPTYRPGNGGDNTGSFYSFGATSSTDRALGGAASSGTYFGNPGPASGTVAGYIAVAFENDSGNALSDFTISFDGEQWRNGGNASAQTMTLQYGFGSSFSSVSTWITPGGGFNWASPVTGATAGAVDGNGAGLVTGVGGSVTGLTWNSGDTLWVRWIENNDAGNDHGLAIDDLSFSSTVSAVPEPGTLALASIGGAACLVAFRRRK